MSLLGAIEAGGTKMVCGVGRPGESLQQTTIPTEDPNTTIANIIGFFEKAQKRHGSVAALGLASFGPLNLNPKSPSYGRLLSTPKAGWQGVNLHSRLRDALNLQTAIDTDVNAAALAESTIGAAKGCASVAYVTVGTGIGVGFVIEGRTVRGFGHPEAGHLLLRRDAEHGAFRGICPFHGDCLEGLASGPAIAAAWGGPLSNFVATHPAWRVQAHYLAQLCASLILTVAPEHIVLGGGVMSELALFDPIRQATLEILGGYSANWATELAVKSQITPPGCAEPSGLVGAYLLAQNLVADRT